MTEFTQCFFIFCVFCAFIFTVYISSKFKVKYKEKKHRSSIVDEISLDLDIEKKE